MAQLSAGIDGTAEKLTAGTAVQLTAGTAAQLTAGTGGTAAN